MGPHQNSLKVQVRSEVKHQDGVDLGVDAVVVSSLMEKKCTEPHMPVTMGH